jgi:Dyp-type peroxidase family
MNGSALDLAAIQGIVLRGYRMPVGSYVFVSFADPASGRAWVASMVDPVTSAAPWEAKPDWALNVAFSSAGLRALGVDEDTMSTFPTAFLEGMAARASALGDTGSSAPEHWRGGLGTEQVHALVLVSALTAELLAQRLDWLTGTLNSGVAQVHRQDVAVLAGGTEHFGYADGFSQPDIEGLETGSRHGQGIYTGDDQWRPIRPGEFVLGYPDEEGVLPAAPRPDEFGRNGSYLAFRALQQDVAAFREQLVAQAVRTGLSTELLAAKFVGRWRDGTPLALSPDHPDGELVTDPERANSFDYADDPDGYRCPFGAHIRRANPRLSMPFDGKLVNRHRLVRRGLPFGPALPPDAPDDGVERGVVFVCFQSDLERQFEFIQSQWFDDGNAFRLGADQDPLLGDHQGGDKFTINGKPPAFAAPLRRVVTVLGGEYFFAPGINGLTYLSNLSS